MFHFDEEKELFEAEDDSAYLQLQLARLDQETKPWLAFSLVNKLLALN